MEISIQSFAIWYKVNGLEKSVFVPTSTSFEGLLENIEKVKKEIELDLEKYNK